jgi:hypothetical protein
MITSLQWVLVAVLIDPSVGAIVDHAVLDYYNTRRECFIERNVQPAVVNVKYVCLRRDQL